VLKMASRCGKVDHNDIFLYHIIVICIFLYSILLEPIRSKIRLKFQEKKMNRRFLHFVVLLILLSFLSACTLQTRSTEYNVPSTDLINTPQPSVSPKNSSVTEPTQTIQLEGSSASLSWARDVAVGFLVSQYGMPPAADWTEEALLPSTPGSAQSRFTSGPWVVVVSSEASAPAPNQVHVLADHMSEAVRWEGFVNADGSVTETQFTRAGQDVQTGGEQPLQQWTGSITSLPVGAQYDDIFTSNSKDQAVYGIDGATPEINQLIAQYRDTNTLVSIEGYLSLNVPDVNNCQIRVTKLTLSGIVN